MSKNQFIEITDTTIIPEDIISKLEVQECGAVVTFTGRVRGYSAGKKVLALEHDLTGKKAQNLVRKINNELQKKWDIQGLSFCCRTGPVPAGEVTLVIAVSTIHRPEAFAACQYIIDRFKQLVSAKEIREDGEFPINTKT